MQDEALEIIARAMAMTRNDSEIGWEHYTLDAEEVVTALSEKGMVIVPKEPTEAMLIDGSASLRNFYSEDGPYPRTKAVYRAMLSAHEDGK